MSDYIYKGPTTKQRWKDFGRGCLISAVVIALFCLGMAALMGLGWMIFVSGAWFLSALGVIICIVIGGLLIASEQW